MTNPLQRITKNTHTTIHNPQPPTNTHNNPQPPTKNHWTDQALCQGQTHKMFPKEHKDLSYITEARRLCRLCPVRKECLEYALGFPASDQHGVWAGLTPRQLAVRQVDGGVRPVRFTLAQVWGFLNRG